MHKSKKQHRADEYVKAACSENMLLAKSPTVIVS